MSIIFCLVVLVTANMSVSALTYSSSFESYIKLTINKAVTATEHWTLALFIFVFILICFICLYFLFRFLCATLQ